MLDYNSPNVIEDINCQSRNHEVVVEQNFDFKSAIKVFAHLNEVDEGTAEQAVNWFNEQIVASKITGVDKHWTEYQQRLSEVLTFTGKSKEPAYAVDFLDHISFAVDENGNGPQGFSNVGLWKWMYVQYQLEQIEHKYGHLDTDYLYATADAYSEHYAKKATPSMFVPDNDINLRLLEESALNLELITHYCTKGKITLMCVNKKIGIIYLDMDAENPARHWVIERLTGKGGLRVRLGKLQVRHNLSRDAAHLKCWHWEVS
jgi:hypothetical protein